MLPRGGGSAPQHCYSFNCCVDGNSGVVRQLAHQNCYDVFDAAATGGRNIFSATKTSVLLLLLLLLLQGSPLLRRGSVARWPRGAWRGVAPPSLFWKGNLPQWGWLPDKLILYLQTHAKYLVSLQDSFPGSSIVARLQVKSKLNLWPFIVICSDVDDVLRFPLYSLVFSLPPCCCRRRPKGVSVK